MNILLDTHTFIWFVDDNSNLSSSAKYTIENSLEVYISIASVWEIAIKRSLNKLEFDVSIEDIFIELDKLNIKLLNLTENNLIEVEKLPFHHKDPFDRLIIAQSITNDLAVISKDRVYNKYNINMIW